MSKLWYSWISTRHQNCKSLVNDTHTSDCCLSNSRYNKSFNSLQAGSNISLILPLAREYQMEELSTRCERYLLSRPASVQSLALAEEYSLPALHRCCMGYAHSVRLAELYSQPEFELLSSDTKVRLRNYEMQWGGCSEGHELKIDNQQ